MTEAALAPVESQPTCAFLTFPLQADPQPVIFRQEAGQHTLPPKQTEFLCQDINIREVLSTHVLRNISFVNSVLNFGPYYYTTLRIQEKIRLGSKDSHQGQPISAGPCDQVSLLEGKKRNDDICIRLSENFVHPKIHKFHLGRD